MPDSGQQQLVVVVLYHPDDQEAAKSLKSILVHRGFNCHLLYDVVGPDILTGIFERAEEAHCIVALLTKRLFADKKLIAYHRKVHGRHAGRKFIPVNVDVPEDVIELPEAGFLEGCHLLKADWDSEDFRDRLANAVSCTARRVALASEQTPSTSSAVDVTENSPATIDNSVSDVVRDTHGGGVQDIRRSATQPDIAGPGQTDGREPASGSTPQKTTVLHLSNTVPVMSASASTAPGADSTSSATNVHGTEDDEATHPSQETNMTVRLDCGLSQRGQVVREQYCMPDGQIIDVAVKRLTSNENAKEYVKREKSAKDLRSPFILPILEVADEPTRVPRIITPYHSGGNLEDFLNPASTSSLRSLFDKDRDLRSHLVMIAYQLSEAVDLLHSRGFVHGNVNPRKVVLDQHGNARLGDFGKSLYVGKNDFGDGRCDENFEARAGYEDGYAEKDSPKSFGNDIFAFGIILLQVLKWTSAAGETGEVPTLFLRLLADHNQEFPTVEVLVADERYVDRTLWPKDRISNSICATALECLKTLGQRITSDGIKKRLKQCLTLLQLPLMTFPDQKCIYCSIGKLNADLQPLSSGCSDQCEFLQMCASCLRLAERNRLTCPRHSGANIRSPIGGKRAYALMICGKDENQDTAQTFLEDCRKMMLIASHPKIFAIPRRNIYQITPFENVTRDGINRVLQHIVASQPTFFLLYYSGHMETAGDVRYFDVSSQQGDALNCKQLQQALRRLTRLCPRIFVILDCCNAASMNLLPPMEAGKDDAHVAWHIFWPASGRRESSNIQMCDENSVFTKYFLAGLTGGRCPDSTCSVDCQTSDKYRQDCLKTGVISLHGIDRFLRHHMTRRPQEERSDTQRPIMSQHRREEPVLAYFTEGPLYQFQYESPDRAEKCVCTVDYIGFDVDDVLQNLWRQLKAKYLPKNLDHRTLEIRRRVDGRQLLSTEEIIDAVCDYDETLMVGIRTDGAELDVDKWVACFCDVSETVATVDNISTSDSESNCARNEVGVTRLLLRHLSTSWQPKHDNGFDKALESCWRSFCALKLRVIQSSKKIDCLRVEIRDNLSMFSVTLHEPDIAH